MTMRRPSPLALAVVAAAALAGAGLSACGDDSELLPGGRAAALQAELDRVAAGVSSGDCAAAEQALSRVQGQLVNLPRSTDAELRERLEDGVNNLRARVPAACQAGEQPSTRQQDQTETETQGTDEQQTDETDTGTTEETTPPTDTDETQPPDETTQTQPPDNAPPAGTPESNGTGGASAGGQGEGG
jgi:hypothetical protein